MGWPVHSPIVSFCHVQANRPEGSSQWSRITSVYFHSGSIDRIVIVPHHRFADPLGSLAASEPARQLLDSRRLSFGGYRRRRRTMWVFLGRGSAGLPIPRGAHASCPLGIITHILSQLACRSFKWMTGRAQPATASPTPVKSGQTTDTRANESGKVSEELQRMNAAPVRATIGSSPSFPLAGDLVVD